MTTYELVYQENLLKIPCDPISFFEHVAIQEIKSQSLFQELYYLVEKNGLFNIMYNPAFGALNVVDYIFAARDYVLDVVNRYKYKIISHLETYGYKVLYFKVENVDIKIEYGNPVNIFGINLPVRPITKIIIEMKYSILYLKPPIAVGVGLSVIVIAIILVIGAVLAVKIYTDEVTQTQLKEYKLSIQAKEELYSKFSSDVYNLYVHFEQQYGKNFLQNPKYRKMFFDLVKKYEEALKESQPSQVPTKISIPQFPTPPMPPNPLAQYEKYLIPAGIFIGAVLIYKLLK